MQKPPPPIATGRTATINNIRVQNCAGQETVPAPARSDLDQFQKASSACIFRVIYPDDRQPRSLRAQ